MKTGDLMCRTIHPHPLPSLTKIIYGHSKISARSNIGPPTVNLYLNSSNIQQLKIKEMF